MFAEWEELGAAGSKGMLAKSQYNWSTLPRDWLSSASIFLESLQEFAGLSWPAPWCFCLGRRSVTLWWPHESHSKGSFLLCHWMGQTLSATEFWLKVGLSTQLYLSLEPMVRLGITNHPWRGMAWGATMCPPYVLEQGLSNDGLQAISRVILKGPWP